MPAVGRQAMTWANDKSSRDWRPRDLANRVAPIESVLKRLNALLGGDNIQLHKPNPSTTGPNPPPDEMTACHMDDSGLGS